MRLLRVCAEPVCPDLAEPGRWYCPRHAEARAEAQADRLRAADREIKGRSPWRWVYKTRRWQGLRRQVLLEQPWCAVVECVELSRDVDHVVALQDGGAPFRSGQRARAL